LYCFTDLFVVLPTKFWGTIWGTNMYYNLSLVLDRRRANKDKKYQVALRLYFKGTKQLILLNVWIEKDHWDPDNERILPPAKLEPTVSWNNDRITEKKIIASKTIARLEELGELNKITSLDLKRKIQNKSQKPSFTDYLNSLITIFEEHRKTGQVMVYTNARKFLQNYIPDRKVLEFEDITFKLLKTIEYKYIARDNSYNGLSVYLRTIRSVYNKAIKEWPELKDLYPFSDYKIRQIKTHKTALRRDEMEKLLKLPVDQKQMNWHGRNLFFFSFYCRGMNLADIAKLKVSDLKGDRIIYKRSKNSKPFSVKITPNIQNLIDTYIIGKNSDDYLFPVIRDPRLKHEEQITEFRNLTNHSLKRWAKKLGINPSLSFNTARHTWATIGKEMNIPIAAISEGLGHNDIRTTQIYLDSFNDEIIDGANELIGNSIPPVGK